MATGTNPFSRIVSTRQAEAAKTAAEVQAAADEHPQSGRDGHETGFIRPADAAASTAALEGHASGQPTAAAPAESAASQALSSATEARAAQLAEERLHDGQHSTTTHDPDNTPPPHGAAGTADLRGTLTSAEASAHGQLAGLEGSALQSHDPTGSSNIPLTPGERLDLGDAGRLAPESTQQAASQDPNEHGDGASTFASLQRTLEGQLSGGHVAEELGAALTGMGDGSDRAGSALNVADDGPLANAINSLTPADIANVAANAGVTPPSSGASGSSNSTPAPAPATPPTHKDDGAGVLSTLFTHGPAAAASVLLSQVNSPTVNLSEAQQLKQVDGHIGEVHDKQTEAQQAPHVEGGAVRDSSSLVDKFLHLVSSSSGNSAGGGAKLTDPDGDPGQGAPNPAGVAFARAIAELEHVGPGFHNPGNVDPGGEGDLSGLQTGLAGAATVAGSTGVRGGESLFGNPNEGAGAPATGQPASGLTGFGHGGAGGDTQTGIVGDDGNSAHTTVHENGPGAEHFGPSEGVGASAPPPSNDTGSPSAEEASGAPVAVTESPALFEDMAFHAPDHLLAASEDD